MKIYVKLISVGLMILIWGSFAFGVNQSRPANWDKERQERKICRDLCKTVVSWLIDGNDLAGAECDRLADSLLSLEEPSVKAYFIAAQVARLRQKPQKGIAILEEVILREPNEVLPQIAVNIPVKIIGYFWIASIAKQSGDIATANKAYETILQNLENTKNLEGKGALQITCNLYLAEIEFQHLKRKDLALARLEAIERVKKPVGPLGMGYGIYKGLARYHRTRISEGKARAGQQLVAHPEMTLAPLSAVSQLRLCGLSGAPLDSCASDKRINIVTNILVDRTVKSTASSLERSFVRLVYGFGYQGEGQRAQKEELHPEAEKYYLEAEKYYSALFEDDSFFSPVAGLYLGRCKKAQGKTAEAESVLEQVRAKYPGYDSAVVELKESWRKETR